MADISDEENGRVPCKGGWFSFVTTNFYKPKSLALLVVLCLGAFIGIGLPSTLQKLHWTKPQTIRVECQLPMHFRLECLPGKPSLQYSEERCKELDCCWDNDTSSATVPRCFHCIPSPFHYTVHVDPRLECREISLRENSPTSSQNDGVRKNVSVLSLEAIPSQKVASNSYMPGVQAFRIKMEAHHVDDNRLMIKFFEVEGYRGFEPDKFLRYGDQGFRPYDSKYTGGNKNCFTDSNRAYEVLTANKNERFFLDVKRKPSNRHLFNTDFGALIFATQYIEFTLILPPGSRVYGLGQGDRSSLMHDLTEGHTWSLFNRNHYENNSPLNISHGWYGSHPFYMCIEPDGTAHGVLLAHTNIMEATLTAIPAITFRSTGRWMTFHVFMGPTPGDVIRQLTDVVGKPILPAYWALGHHICRAFEKDHGNEYYEVESSVQQLRKSSIPQESDCVFFSNVTTPWSLDPQAWESVVTNLQAIGIRTTMVHRPHVDASQETGTWIRRNRQVYEGLWNKRNIKYMDVFKTELVSKQILQEITQNSNKSGVNFSGFILTDNIPSDESDMNKCKVNSVSRPPFLPGSVSYLDSLTETTDTTLSLLNETICLDACHDYDCEEVANIGLPKMDFPYHYNLHNLYGHAHAETVHSAFQVLSSSNKKRPFILTLSSFTGTGRYAGQWGGQIEATWPGLKRALLQMLEFNFYGIPFTGTPACGYTGPIQRDLCSRWVQLSAFQPLSLTFRHYPPKMNVSDLPFLQDDLVNSVAAGALQLRLTLLPYFYGVFYNSSLTGNPVVRPLFYEWPGDEKAYLIDEQFMWGSALMVSPVLTPATVTLNLYFPPGTWYDFYDGSLIHFGEQGHEGEVMAIEYHINLHLRGGHIIPTQRARMTTAESRMETYKIQVALEQTGNKQEDEIAATGELYIDDGDGYGRKLLVNMSASRQSILFTPTGDVSSFLKDKPSDYSLVLETVFVLGLKKPYSDCFMASSDGNSTRVTCRHDSIRAVLSLRDLTLDLRENTTIYWKYE